ncbi:ribonuclease Y [Mycoplasmoides genitalium]|uniref:Ribonuclease Y n=1 Tax=Mycoplasma genitalium (strain ATCC 33530 / DSM 19775 / NCTC 10195 / G37) TaxID=243273 RepID=RNY_MYCGE|nr:ribonuclease Y [Mycoplasmoides genitalium]P47376.1 RecName: Full=Ribonuclease Y; Short=RNase Y [Mycoplasmoides genitalium G37]AAC71348.1 uncharacterized domain HDIG [Mycoplasmoides genitalium G37]ABY79673.1 uncharacterized domain HDIG [synthetic Mycoplasma genitalium JCVI-1.0]
MNNNITNSIAQLFFNTSFFAFLFLIIIAFNLCLFAYLYFQYRIYKKNPKKANNFKANEYEKIKLLKNQNFTESNKLIATTNELNELTSQLDNILVRIINKPLAKLVNDFLDEQIKQIVKLDKNSSDFHSESDNLPFYTKLFNDFHFGVDKLININIKNPLYNWVYSPSFLISESDFRKLNGISGINKKLLVEKLRIEDIVFTDLNKKYEVNVLTESPIKAQKTVLTVRNILMNDYVDNERIESYVQQANFFFTEHCKKIGKEILESLNIFISSSSLHRHFGFLAFRYSFGQNVLSHSLETAFLTAHLAALIELDSELSLKCGLLHDIGKSNDDNGKESHTITGAKLAEQFQLPDDIKYTIANHHNKHIDNTYCRLTQIADKLSAARIGARSDSSLLFKQLKDELKKIVDKTINNFHTTILLGQSGRRLMIWLETKNQNQLLSNEQIIEMVEKIKAEIAKNPITNHFPIKVVIRYNFEHSFNTKS